MNKQAHWVSLGVFCLALVSPAVSAAQDLQRERRLDEERERRRTNEEIRRTNEEIRGFHEEREKRTNETHEDWRELDRAREEKDRERSSQWQLQIDAARNAYEQGDYPSAVNHAKDALDIAKRFGEKDSRFVASLKNLAILYRNQGGYAEAEPLLRRILAIDEKELGAEHPEFAADLTIVGTFYKDWKKYSNAKPLYQRALTIVEKVYGEHSSVGASLNNLAGLYVDMGNYSEAEVLFKRSLATLERSLGPENTSLVTVLRNYAVLLARTNRELEASGMMSRIKAIEDKAKSEADIPETNIQQNP